jgi:hypothetical protein
LFAQFSSLMRLANLSRYQITPGQSKSLYTSFHHMSVQNLNSFGEILDTHTLDLLIDISGAEG